MKVHAEAQSSQVYSRLRTPSNAAAVGSLPEVGIASYNTACSSQSGTCDCEVQQYLGDAGSTIVTGSEVHRNSTILCLR